MGAVVSQTVQRVPPPYSSLDSQYVGWACTSGACASFHLFRKIKSEKCDIIRSLVRASPCRGAEMVDRLVSKTGELYAHEGSSPSLGTEKTHQYYVQ